MNDGHTFADFLYHQRRRVLKTLHKSEARIRKARQRVLVAAEAEWAADRHLGHVPRIVQRNGLDYYDRRG